MADELLDDQQQGPSAFPPLVPTTSQAPQGADAPPPPAPTMPGLPTTAFPRNPPDRLTDAMERAPATAPDTAAKIFELQLKTGLPHELIARNLAEVEKQASAAGFDAAAFRAKSPLLASWLEQHPLNAAVAQDDLVPLSNIEATLRFAKTAVRQTAAGLYKGMDLGTWSLLEAMGDTLKLPGLVAWAKQRNADAAYWTDRIAGPAMPGAATSPNLAAAVGAFRSIGTMGPAMVPAFLSGGATAGENLMLTLMGTQTGGEGYSTAREQGLGVGPSAAYGFLQGATMAAAGKLPVHALLGDLAAGSGLTKTLIHQTLTAVPAMQVQVAVQDFNEWAYLHPERPFEDYLRERPQAAMSALVGAVLQTVVQGGAAHTLNRIVGGLAAGQTVKDLAAESARSKVAQRAPSKFDEFVTHAGGDQEAFYAPVDTFTQHFQDLGIDPAAKAAELTGDNDAYARALRTGTDLAIPPGRLASELAHDPAHHEFFTQELRLTPDSMNAREAEAFRDATKTATAPAAEPSRLDEVQQALVEQLRGAGFSPEAADTNAEILKRLVGIPALRAGLDPLAVYRQYGITVTREGLTPLPAPAGGATLAPGETRPGAPGPAQGGLDLKGRPIEPASPGAGGAGLQGGGEAGPDHGGVDAIPAAFRDHFAGLAGDARTAGYTGSDNSLANVFLSHLAEARSIQEGMSLGDEEAATGREMLQLISRIGGMGIGKEAGGGATGELENLLESLHKGTKSTAVIKRGKRAGQEVKLPPRQSGGLPGIAGIIKREGGLSLDRVRESVNEDPRWAGKFENLSDFLSAVEDAILTEVGVMAPKTEGAVDIGGILSELLNVRPGGDWWKQPAVDMLAEPTAELPGATPTSFDTELYQDLFDALGPDPSEPVDVLATGEVQPRLPGEAGAVRDLEIAQPAIAELRDEFKLTAPEETRAKQTSLFQRPVRSRVKELEELATDEAMGVRFPLDGESTFPDGSAAVVCTNCAERIIAMLGEGQVYGWKEGTNPTSVVAGPEQGAHTEDGQGHDFAIVQGRYLVDPWAKNVEGSSDRAAFDLLDPKDRAEVKRLYGDPATWLKREPTKGGGYKWVKAIPPALAVKELAQSVYHGTAAEFDKFELHAIGSGQGAATFGWGLYFASQREIADKYREQLAGPVQPKSLNFRDEGNVYLGRHSIIAQNVRAESGLYERMIEQRNDPDTSNDNRRHAGRIVQGLSELHTRVMWAPAGDEGIKKIRRDLEASIKNIETAIAAGHTFSGEAWQDKHNLDNYKAALEVLDEFPDDFHISPAKRPGRTYTVEIPDDADYLDWDKTASQQSPKVQEALKKLGVGWDPLKIPTPAQALRSFESQRVQRDAASDIGIREEVRRGYDLAQRAYNLRKEPSGAAALAKFEAWYSQHQGIMRGDGVIDPVGEDIYQGLAHAQRGTAGSPWGTAQRLASEAMNRHGIAGIRYLDGYSRAAAVAPVFTGDPAHVAAARDFKKNNYTIDDARNGLHAAYKDATNGEIDAALNEAYGIVPPAGGTSNFVLFDPQLATIKEYDQSVDRPFTQEAVDAWVEATKAELGPDLLHLDVHLTSAGDLTLDTLAIARGAQRAGLGTQVMQKLVRLADGQRRRITLSVADKGYLKEDTDPTTSRDRLVRFYKRFGFVRNAGRYLDMSLTAGMYRDPTASSRSLGVAKPEPSPLVVQHNITAENIRHALKMGGIPVPSLAITKADASWTKFGEITLLGRREMADPRGYARTRVFAGDLYAPRYPDVEFKVDTPALKSINDTLAPYRQEGEREIYSGEIDKARDFEGNKAFDRYAEANFKDPATGYVDTKAAGNALLHASGAGERIFQGFTDLGNRRYTPHTLENVVRILKREIRGSETSGNVFGTGQMRAKFMPEFRSVKAIRAAKGKIVSDADFEKVKKEVETDLFAITNSLSSYGLDTNRFGAVDTVMAAMEDSRRLGLVAALKEYGITGVDDKTKQAIVEFMMRLRDMPTEYFEAKIMRAVSLAEFAGAVVPADAPADVVKALRDHGLDISTYDRADGGAARDAARVKATHELALKLGEKVLFQDPKDRRGVLRFGPDRQMNIGLFENADLTTFVHEAGHLGLEVFNDIVDHVKGIDEAARTDEQRGLIADQAALFEALGVKDRAELAANDQAHERFTETLSRYLMDGTAPSIGLRRVFARIRSWLLAFYSSIKPHLAKLTPEVRGVFDRMLATDREIAEAEQEGHVAPMFTTAESAGMAPDDFALYRDTVADASRTAREQLETRLMAELQREQRATWKERKADVRAQVEAEQFAKPVYQALAAMQRGTKPDGTPLIDGADAPTPAKLSRQAIVDRYGEERLARLPKPYVYSREGGMDPDHVADIFGFSSGDELLTAIEQAGPLKAVIAHETEKRMLAEHGSLLLDGTLHDRARAAVDNDYREQVIRAELRALGGLKRTAAPFVKAGEEKLAAAQANSAYERRWFEAEAKLRIAIAEGHKQVDIDALTDEVRNLRQKARGGAATIRAAIPPDAVLRQIVEDQVAGMPVGSLKPETFWSAARRASRLATDAAARQDFNTAIDAKQKELLSVKLYRAVSDAKDDVDARVRRARQLQTPAAQSRIGKAGHGILEQLNAVLARFNFRQDQASAPAMRAWVESLQGESVPGLELLPDELLDDTRRQPFGTLTYEQLVGVTDGIDQLAHLATLMNQLLGAERDKAFAEVRDGLVSSIRAKNTVRKVPLEFRPSNERWRAAEEWYAGHAKLSTFTLALDGGEDGGPMWEAFTRQINAASDTEVNRASDAGTRYHELLDKYYTSRERAHFGDRLFIPAIGDSLSKEARLEVLKNFGNKTSRDRLLSDPVRKWTEAQVRAIIDTLDRRDGEYVQAHWDFLNEFWPEIAAKSKRLTGVEPKKVEPLAVTTQWGELRGGYHPLVYDRRLDVRVNRQEQVTEAKLAVAGAYIASTTARGHEKTRVAHLDRPIRLEMSTTFAHISQVLHDLTHHEMLIDTTRLLRDPALAKAIQETRGDITYQKLSRILQDIAQGDRAPGGLPSLLEKSATWLRTRAQIAGLGYNVWVMLQQPLGMFNGMERVGVKWVAKGVGRWLRDAASMENTAHWIADQSPMMRERLGGRGLTQDLRDVQASLGRSGSWFDKLLRTVSADHITQRGLLDSYMWGIGLAQSVADVPTWLGEYEKQMAANPQDEKRAVALADQAVLDSQGGAHIKDLAQEQRGGPLARLFMTFASYSVTVLNSAERARLQTDARSPASVLRFAWRLGLLYVMPQLLTEVMRCGIGRANCEDPASFIKRMAGGTLTTALNGVAGIREIAPAFNVMLHLDQTGTRGYEGTAGSRPLQTVFDVATQINQGKWDDGAEKAALHASGLIFKYPADQVQRSIDGFVALNEGRTHNPAALLVGPPPKKQLQ